MQKDQTEGTVDGIDYIITTTTTPGSDKHSGTKDPENHVQYNFQIEFKAKPLPLCIEGKTTYFPLTLLTLSFVRQPPHKPTNSFNCRLHLHKSVQQKQAKSFLRHLKQGYEEANLDYSGTWKIYLGNEDISEHPLTSMEFLIKTLRDLKFPEIVIPHIEAFDQERTRPIRRHKGAPPSRPNIPST